jgi:hypothetical protein
VLEGWLAQWRGSVDSGSACPSSSQGARLSAGCQPIRFAAAARFDALGSGLPDSVLSDSKSPQRIFRRGLNSCDDEDIPVIFPTCQLFDAEIAERRERLK